MPDLSVVIPALDEGPNLDRLLPLVAEVLAGLAVAHEVIVVTKKGDAGTIDAARRHGATVRFQETPGYGGALAAGFAEARGTWVLTMDADGSHLPATIADLWAARDGAGLVIASRYIRGGSAEMPRDRLVLSCILNGVHRAVGGWAVHDGSSGFRLHDRRLVAGLPIRSRTFASVYEVLAAAHVGGWTVREVPFAYAPRVHGRSHASAIRFAPEYLRGLRRIADARSRLSANPAAMRKSDPEAPYR